MARKGARGWRPAFPQFHYEGRTCLVGFPGGEANLEGAFVDFRFVRQPDIPALTLTAAYYAAIINPQECRLDSASPAIPALNHQRAHDDLARNYVLYHLKRSRAWARGLRVFVTDTKPARAGIFLGRDSTSLAACYGPLIRACASSARTTDTSISKFRAKTWPCVSFRPRAGEQTPGTTHGVSVRGHREGTPRRPRQK